MDEVTFARLARQAGFGRTGFCSARAFEAEREAVALGPEIAERRQLKFDPIGDDERTKSLAVLLWPYNPAEKEEKGCVFVDGYYFASNAAYHAARKLEEDLEASWMFCQSECVLSRAGSGFACGHRHNWTERHADHAGIRFEICYHPDGDGY